MTAPIKLGSYVVGRRLSENEWLAHAIVDKEPRYASIRVSELLDERHVVVDPIPRNMGGLRLGGVTRTSKFAGLDSQVISQDRHVHDRVADLDIKNRIGVMIRKHRKVSSFIAGFACVGGIALGAINLLQPASDQRHIEQQMKTPAVDSPKAQPTAVASPATRVENQGALQVPPTAASSKSETLTASWFLSQLSAQPQTTNSRALAGELGWSHSQEVASRLISKTGDLSLYALCTIDLQARTHCANVVVETSATGPHIREMIKPAA